MGILTERYKLWQRGFKDMTYQIEADPGLLQTEGVIWLHIGDAYEGYYLAVYSSGDLSYGTYENAAIGFDAAIIREWYASKPKNTAIETLEYVIQKAELNRDRIKRALLPLGIELPELEEPTDNQEAAL